MITNTSAIAWIRTTVPAIVGTLIAWAAKWALAKWGLHINITTATAYVAPLAIALCTGIYYAGIKLLEKKVPSLGWLLGYKASVSYAAPAEVLSPTTVTTTPPPPPNTPTTTTTP